VDFSQEEGEADDQGQRRRCERQSDEPLKRRSEHHFEKERREV
jgi:hypothetical protein